MTNTRLFTDHATGELVTMKLQFTPLLPGASIWTEVERRKPAELTHVQQMTDLLLRGINAEELAMQAQRSDVEDGERI